MPFNIDSITFSDEFNTGTTSELNANVSDEITATINVTYEALIDASLSTSTKIKAEPYSLFPYSGNQSFFLEGITTIDNDFYIGNIEITSSFGATTFTIAEIVNEFGGIRIVCNEANTYSGTNPSGTIYISEALTTCNLDYRVSGTSNNNNYAPLIEINGNQAANFATTGTVLDASSATVIDIPFTYNGAYQTGGLTISGQGVGTYSQSFELVHTFICAPISIYNDGAERQPDNYSPVNGSTYSDLFNPSQAKYGFNGNFGSSVLGGVNIPLEIVQSPYFRIFNQKLIGGDTNYSYSNFSIVRTSDSEVANVPIVQAKFTVSFDVENTDDTPFSNSNTKVKVGIENLPETIDNTEDYIQTFLYDRAINTLGGGAVAGSSTGDAASITNYTATFNSTSSISVSFDVEFSANAITQINNSASQYFSIFVETQDHLKSYSDSDRVVLQVFRGLGIQNILADPIEVVESKFITAPYDDWGSGIDASEIDGFPTQLLVGSTRFFANWSGRDGLRINTVSQNLVLKNSVTLEEIPLESESINVNAFPLVSSQYPDIDFNIEKGYKIPTDEVRNRVRMFNDGDGGDAHYFQAIFPFFIRWEYYTDLILSSVPASILDYSEPNNGKNYFLNRIDSLADWTLNYRVNFKCSESGINFDQDFDYTISTSPYESHPEVTNRLIRSFKEDGVTPLENGAIKFIDNDENTLISYESTLSTAPTDVSEFELEIYIEAFEFGSPTKIQRISSVNSLLDSSWFTDTGAGDGLIAKSIDGNKAIGKVLIDVNKLAKYGKYRVYGNIYTPPRPTDYFIAENGDNLIAENNDNFIRE